MDSMDQSEHTESTNIEERRMEAMGIDSEELWKPPLHEWLIMLSLALVSLMVSLDATIIITSLSAVITELRINTSDGFWIGTSYLLTCASTMPFIASLSDIFGRSVCLVSSLGLFTIGTIVCCIAHSIATLIAGRCIQGIGGGGIIILALVILTDIVPLRFRPKYFGVIQAAWAIGTCIGPLIGGALVLNTTWRWIFYLMFPFCFLGIITIPWLLTLRPRTDSIQGKLLRVDWFGGFLFIASSTAFLVAISWGGVQEPWSSFRTILPLVSGVVGIAAALLWEGMKAKEPFLRRSLFYCTSSYAAYTGAAVQGLLLYGQLYYIPFYFLSVKGFSPVHTGVALLPVTLALVPSSMIVGAVVTRKNAFRWAIWSGWAILTLATGLTLIWDVHTSTAAWAVILIVLGVGHGLVLNAQNFATQAICRPRDEGAAAAMYAFLRSFGMAVGVGIGGSIFQNVMKIKLRKLGLPVSIADDAEGYIATLRTLDDLMLKEHVLQAYVYGFRGVYGSFCGISGLAGSLSLLIRHFDMNKELDSEHKLSQTRWSKAVLPNATEGGT